MSVYLSFVLLSLFQSEYINPDWYFGGIEFEQNIAIFVRYTTTPDFMSACWIHQEAAAYDYYLHNTKV